MTTRRSIFIGTAVAAVAVLWYLFRPEALIIDKTVNEAFPAADHAVSAAMAESPATAEPASAMAAESHARAQRSMATDDPVKLVSGRFHSNAHETKGLAAIYRLADGRRMLRLTDFTTSRGPDVRVYLVAAGDVQDEGTAKRAGFVDLGALKGNIGDQNYEVPASLDLSQYRAVSIWCRRFSVNFGAAPLGEAM